MIAGLTQYARERATKAIAGIQWRYAAIAPRAWEERLHWPLLAQCVVCAIMLGVAKDVAWTDTLGNSWSAATAGVPTRTNQLGSIVWPLLICAVLGGFAGQRTGNSAFELFGYSSPESRTPLVIWKAIPCLILAFGLSTVSTAITERHAKVCQSLRALEGPEWLATAYEQVPCAARIEGALLASQKNKSAVPPASAFAYAVIQSAEHDPTIKQAANSGCIEPVDPTRWKSEVRPRVAAKTRPMLDRAEVPASQFDAFPALAATFRDCGGKTLHLASAWISWLVLSGVSILGAPIAGRNLIALSQLVIVVCQPIFFAGVAAVVFGIAAQSKYGRALPSGWADAKDFGQWVTEQVSTDPYVQVAVGEGFVIGLLIVHLFRRAQVISHALVALLYLPLVLAVALQLPLGILAALLDVPIDFFCVATFLVLVSWGTVVHSVMLPRLDQNWTDAWNAKPSQPNIKSILQAFWAKRRDASDAGIPPGAA